MVCLSIPRYRLGCLRHLEFFNGVWRIFCKAVSVYLDDILVSGSTVDKHLLNLDKVLNKLETAGLKAKCSFLMPQVEYLGHIIDQYGLYTR